MGVRNPLWFVFWAAMLAAPLLICAYAVGQIPNVELVPLHWGMSGEINRWGTPAELSGIYWFLGASMAFVNALMAACFFFNDKLYAMGLVHGVSKKNAPKIYVGCAILMLAVTAAILSGITSSVLEAL